jgi:hypothetical protein
MIYWRIVAVTLGLALMAGETIRSCGQGRNLLFVLDDFAIGIPLVVTAIMVGRPSPGRCCAFSAAWAATAGALYGSFFSKVVDPASPMHSNIAVGLLTTLIGVAFAVSIAGTVASVALSRRALAASHG